MMDPATRWSLIIPQDTPDKLPMDKRPSDAPPRPNPDDLRIEDWDHGVERGDKLGFLHAHAYVKFNQWVFIDLPNARRVLASYFADIRTPRSIYFHARPIKQDRNEVDARNYVKKDALLYVQYD